MQTERMNEDKQIDQIAKVIRKLAFDLRQNMTSITRYVKLERSKYPSLTAGQFVDRHLEYRDLALAAVNNILKCIHENDELHAIEKMRFENNCYRKESEIVAEIFAEIEGLFIGGAEEGNLILYCDFAELRKKWIGDKSKQ